jgi:hypothetical protein
MFENLAAETSAAASTRKAAILASTLRRAQSGHAPLGTHHMLTNSLPEDKFVDVETPSAVSQPFDDSYNDPNFRSAFASRLDVNTKEAQESSKFIQYLYESRIASLERYVAFCVIFHTMAKASCSPWLKLPWDIARSQSNLRVATTGIENQNFPCTSCRCVLTNFCCQPRLLLL